MAHARLVGLGALVGIPAAAVAALFLGFVHDLQHWLWTDLPDALGESSPPWYLVLGLPVAGAVVVWLARTLLPGDGGHTPLHGIDPAPAPLSHTPGIVLAAAGTLGFGLVLGPEAPVVALGSIVGVTLTSFARLADQETKVLATAGAFAAISALFGGPIVAGVMMTEAAAPTLGAMLVPALLPGFVAAAIGYVIFVGFGNWGGLETAGLAVPNLPPYDGTRVVDLFFAVVIGVATAIAIAAVTRFAIGEVASRLKSRTMAASLLAGGLAVGLIAILADALGANSQDVLFSGQHSISPLVAETSTGVVLLLLVAKAVAYAVSLVAGFRGGPIFPAVFLGIGIATLPVVWFDVSPTFAVSVGAAAGMAAYGRFVLTAMLFAALLVGSQGFDTIPGAVLAAAAAWLTVTAMDQRLEERSASSPPLPS
ncbi:MAG TPA: chloride channel protein [Thermoleophilaceae bacterium]|nr:chloride channel protein [Thermoleophilaceae bacterium]